MSVSKSFSRSTLRFRLGFGCAASIGALTALIACGSQTDPRPSSSSPTPSSSSHPAAAPGPKAVRAPGVDNLLPVASSSAAAAIAAARAQLASEGFQQVDDPGAKPDRPLSQRLDVLQGPGGQIAVIFADPSRMMPVLVFDGDRVVTRQLAFDAPNLVGKTTAELQKLSTSEDAARSLAAEKDGHPREDADSLKCGWYCCTQASIDSCMAENGCSGIWAYLPWCWAVQASCTTLDAIFCDNVYMCCAEEAQCCSLSGTGCAVKGHVQADCSCGACGACGSCGACGACGACGGCGSACGDPVDALHPGQRRGEARTPNPRH